MGLDESKRSAQTRRAEMACFHAVIVIWLYVQQMGLVRLAQHEGIEGPFPMLHYLCFQ